MVTSFGVLMPRVSEPNPTFSQTLNFSPYHVIKQTGVYTSSIYSFAKQCSIQSAKQSLFYWIRDLFRPYYLQWTCMKDLESFNQALDENPFIAIKTFIEILSSHPLKTNQILRSMFHEQRIYAARYPSSQERQSSINELIISILLSPDLTRVKKQLISLVGVISEHSLVEKSRSKINPIREQFNKWEKKIFSSREVKTFSENILVLWEKNKNNLSKFENRDNLNEAVNDVNAFFKELLKDPEIPHPYKILLEKTCRLLSDTGKRGNLFSIVWNLIWEYKVHYGITVGKVLVEDKYGDSKFTRFCKAALRIGK